MGKCTKSPTKTPTTFPTINGTNPIIHNGTVNGTISALVEFSTELFLERLLRGAGGGGGGGGGLKIIMLVSFFTPNLFYFLDSTGGGHGGYHSSSGGGGGCTGCGCENISGETIGIIVGSIFGAIFLVCCCAGLMPIFTNLVATKKCRHEKHLLTMATRDEMLRRGHSNYTDGWICDDCNRAYRAYDQRSQPFMRCYICSLDYCMTCKDKFPQYSFVASRENEGL
jgi:hypothetical protein